MAKTLRRYKVRFTGGISGKSWASPSMCEKLGVWGGRESKHNLVKGWGRGVQAAHHSQRWMDTERTCIAKN